MSVNLSLNLLFIKIRLQFILAEYLLELSSNMAARGEHVGGVKHLSNLPLPSLSFSESDDMVFEDFKRAYLKGVVYGDDDESPTEA